MPDSGSPARQVTRADNEMWVQKSSQVPAGFNAVPTGIELVGSFFHTGGVASTAAVADAANDASRPSAATGTRSRVVLFIFGPLSARCLCLPGP